ncbi:Cms1p NDAI_0C02380 [Naumovozyma dairenensis CBS 421]|uniref:Protein CMS1 n=1 Tax=Naumovozyma dairenensis (strain ATCC 10597 / BCRC 20456 / CBS 421 / NBRC 0211 / NRRL Y-12639) TaxID=1071378 RepID=G0W7Y7_NAUDC|nr:hypothetical protein NDAI_0C02380 [Naumovozyma dairenensis CBS 421]CCD23898.1 hypothetical protein NDAI_0C02380 [Naumovozyma dairenensis CBS 421]
MSNPDDLDDGLLYDYEDKIELQDEEILNEKKRSLKAADESNLLSSVRDREPSSQDVDNNVTDDGDDKHISKRQKKLKNSKLHQKKKEQVAYQIQQLKSLPLGSSELIIEYFATLIREKNPDLSALELNDLYFKKTDFISTAKFDSMDRNLVNFPTFLAQFSKSPKTVILSMSNLRVADVCRSVGGSKMAIKLFAKNKLKDDIETVENIFKDKKNKKNQNLKYFVATPTRMLNILEATEVLFQGKDKLDIIIDASYLDMKKNSILSNENTAVLCKVLKLFLEKKSSVKILLY